MISKQKMSVNSVSRDKAITAAYTAYEKFKISCKRHDYVVIIDYTQPSYRKRLYVYDTATEQVVRSHHVAHGEGSSNEDDRAYCDKFSNTPNSHMSSIGAMVTDDTYHGKHGYSLRINGLEPKNNQVRNRYIVFHAAEYVTDDYIIKNGRAGQSWGCPALDPSICNSLIQLIKGGCFVFGYY